MSNVPRGWTSDENRRLADTKRLPTLAQLPDVSADSLGGRATKQIAPGTIEYRFDSPQPGNSRSRPIASSQSANAQQPHVFERGRPMGQRGIPRRESSVLPRSNPFSNPRPRLIDTVAPAVRFLTMAALFTAAGIWIQMLGRHASPPTRSIEPPKTATHPTAAPAKNADDHTVPAATATGPLETMPEPGARVGRADGDDFASQDQSAAGPCPAEHPTVIPPHFLVAAGSHVPRVQTSDEKPAGAADDTAGANNPSGGEPAGNTESNQPPTVARYPGFLIETPTR